MLSTDFNQESSIKELNLVPNDDIEYLSSCVTTPNISNSTSSHSISNLECLLSTEHSPYQDKKIRCLETYKTKEIPVYTAYVSARPIKCSNIFMELKNSKDFIKTVLLLQDNDTLSTLCFINTTCYSKTDEVIQPSHENFTLVKKVTGLYMSIGAYLAATYYLLIQECFTKEITLQRNNLHEAILLAHRNQKHAKATNPQHTLTYFGNQLCINGLNNSIALAPFTEPFNDYLNILTTQKRPFSDNYKTSELITDFSTTNENKNKNKKLHTLCTLVCDSHSQTYHLTPILDTMHICLLFDDPIILEELLPRNHAAVHFLAPLCIHYDNIRFKLLLSFQKHYQTKPSSDPIKHILCNNVSPITIELTLHCHNLLLRHKHYHLKNSEVHDPLDEIRKNDMYFPPFLFFRKKRRQKRFNKHYFSIMEKHPLTYHIRKNHKNAVASNFAETIILNHDFSDKELWTLLANNADGRADMESTEIQYIIKNGCHITPKCPVLHINKGITYLFYPEYINHCKPNPHSINLYGKSIDNNPIIPASTFTNMELCTLPFIPKLINSILSELYYKPDITLDTQPFSIPCLINSTCYDINDKVIDPDKYNYLHVKKVRGILMYPIAYFALLYEALLIKEQNNAITEEESDTKKQLNNQIVTVFSSTPRDSLFSNSDNKTLHLKTRLLKKGLNNTLSFSPFKNDEPFDEYLRLIQNARSPFNKTVKTDPANFSKSILFNLIWDKSSIKYYFDATINSLDVILLFDDSELFQSFLRRVPLTKGIRLYIVPLMEHYNRVRRSIDCSAKYSLVQFADQIISCFNPFADHSSNRDFLFNLTNYHPDTSTNDEGKTRCQNCFLEACRASTFHRIPKFGLENSDGTDSNSSNNPLIIKATPR